MAAQWSAEERHRCIRWRNAGRMPEWISVRIGRSVDEVVALLDGVRRGMAKTTPPRKCLRCRNEFKPRHAGLFLCDGCKAVNAYLSPVAWPSGDGCSQAGRRSK